MNHWTLLLPDASRTLGVLGASLSILACALLLALCRDCLRRGPRLRPLAVATLRVPGRWQGRAWLVLLIASFLAGLRGLPVLSEERSLEAGVVPSELGAPARATVTALRLPFWIRTARQEETSGGRRLAGSVRDTLQVPWAFLATVGLYGLLGIRRSRGGPGGRGRGGSRAASGAGLLAVLALAALLAALPTPRSAVAAGCAGIGGPLCYTYEECERTWIIVRKCTTEYAYFPEYV